MVLHWDVIPDRSAVSPSCAQAQRNLYVEICEIRHRVAAGSRHMNCVCRLTSSERVSGQGHESGPHVSQPATKVAVQEREVCVDVFLDQKHRIQPNTFLLLFRCANAGQRETVLPVNISE